MQIRKMVMMMMMMMMITPFQFRIAPISLKVIFSFSFPKSPLFTIILLPSKEHPIKLTVSEKKTKKWKPFAPRYHHCFALLFPLLQTSIDTCCSVFRLLSAAAAWSSVPLILLQTRLTRSAFAHTPSPPTLTPAPIRPHQPRSLTLRPPPKIEHRHNSSRRPRTACMPTLLLLIRLIEAVLAPLVQDARLCRR